MAGKFAVEAVLASLFPCFAVALTCVPALAALCATVITPFVGSTLTPSLDGVRLHVEPVFVATTVEFPTVTSTRSASALGVTVTRAFASSLATAGAAGVTSFNCSLAFNKSKDNLLYSAVVFKSLDFNKASISFNLFS